MMLLNLANVLKYWMKRVWREEGRTGCKSGLDDAYTDSCTIDCYLDSWLSTAF